MAAVDYFLKITSPNVSGESLDDKHKGEIDITSWSMGENNHSAAVAATSGAGAGKVKFDTFKVSMKVNKASPALFLACAKGVHYATALLTCRRAGGDQQEYLKVTLSEAYVTSYQTGGGGTDEDVVPTDQVEFSFQKIEFSYAAQNAKGGLDSPLVANWSIQANKGG